MFSTLETLANLRMREFLASVRGRFFHVTFVKRDGEIREMLCQLGNDEAYILDTPQALKASATFRENNPDMLRVRDVNVMRELPEDQKHLSWRTIDCAVIMSARVDGETLELRDYSEALANVKKRVAKKAKKLAA